MTLSTLRQRMPCRRARSIWKQKMQRRLQPREVIITATGVRR